MASPGDATLKSPHVEKKKKVIINKFDISSFFKLSNVKRKTKSLHQTRLCVVAFGA